MKAQLSYFDPSTPPPIMVNDG